jgi:hypothetical protein
MSMEKYAKAYVEALPELQLTSRPGFTGSGVAIRGVECESIGLL